MAEKTVPGTPSPGNVEFRLEATARLLAEESTDIDPNTRKALADLVEEMRTALRSGKVSPAAVAALAENTAQLAESLHHGHDAGALKNVQDRFREAVLDAEVHHPVLAGLSRGVLDTLTGFGI